MIKFTAGLVLGALFAPLVHAYLIPSLIWAWFTLIGFINAIAGA